MLISLISAKGSPGVTTSALALGSCWPRTCVVADVDPSGGDLAAGIGRGTWPLTAGLMELLIDARTIPFDLAIRRRASKPVAHSPLALAGFGQPGQASGVPWHVVANGFTNLPDADVLADCGRYLAAGGVLPLVLRSDVLVVVTRSTLPAVRSAARLVPLLRDELQIEPGDRRLSLLVVGAGRPYSSREIADGCSAPLLGELPLDAGSAAVWSEGAAPGHSFSRSRLQREARRLAGLLAPSGSTAATP
jgi:hypothetical protein